MRLFFASIKPFVLLLLLLLLLLQEHTIAGSELFAAPSPLPPHTQRPLFLLLLLPSVLSFEPPPAAKMWCNSPHQEIVAGFCVASALCGCVAEIDGSRVSRIVRLDPARGSGGDGGGGDSAHSHIFCGDGCARLNKQFALSLLYISKRTSQSFYK